MNKMSKQLWSNRDILRDARKEIDRLNNVIENAHACIKSAQEQLTKHNMGTADTILTTTNEMLYNAIHEPEETKHEEN